MRPNSGRGRTDATEFAATTRADENFATAIRAGVRHLLRERPAETLAPSAAAG